MSKGLFTPETIMITDKYNNISIHTVYRIVWEEHICLKVAEEDGSNIKRDSRNHLLYPSAAIQTPTLQYTVSYWMHDESAYFTVSVSSHEMYFWCCKKRGGEREREINISNANSNRKKEVCVCKDWRLEKWPENNWTREIQWPSCLLLMTQPRPHHRRRQDIVLFQTLVSFATILDILLHTEQSSYGFEKKRFKENQRIKQTRWESANLPLLSGDKHRAGTLLR